MSLNKNSIVLSDRILRVYMFVNCLFVCILFFFASKSFAQEVTEGRHHGSIKGQVFSSDGQPASFVAVGVKGSSKGTTTDAEGKFHFKLPVGKYTLVIQFIGHEAEEEAIEVMEGETVQVPDFRLRESAKELQEVEIVGKSEVQQVRESSYNVTAIDARPLHNSTMDINQVLNKVSGVRIRESGGMGSNFSFSLNGFTGRQVRFFVDGIPMDNFGSSFQLNNIPINLAERIEIYRGVVPIWLGSDALGGAVNVITSTHFNTFLDASYSFGSFNTHKSVINAGYTSKRGFTAQVNLYQNYSDNNYTVTVDVADINTGAYYRNQRVKRFNDQYHNETAIVNVGVVGKKYADRLLFGFVTGQNRAEIQTGARMVNVYGDMYRRGNIFMPTVKYLKKDFLTKGLDLTINGNYNFGQEQNVDTVFRRYNWFQQYKQYDGLGSERSRTLYKFSNNVGIVTTNFNYRLSGKSILTLNNVWNTFNRRGSDELYPENASYEQPRKSGKNILGVGYKYDYNKRWSTSLFVKHYFQTNTFSESYNPVPNSSEVAYRVKNNQSTNLGYGLATTFFILTNLQAKASYELSYRLPETEELFGDMINVEGNTSLKPEHSHNYNFGLNYALDLSEVHHLMLDANVLYRNAKDFIQPFFAPNAVKTVNRNLDNVKTSGFDAELRYSYKRLFTLGMNMTAQNLRDNATHRYEAGQLVENFTYKDRIPNKPFLFGNGYSSLNLRNLMGKGSSVNIGYSMLYVHAYYLYWPSMGESEGKYDIPTQLTHDLNVVFSLKEGRYNLALECRNLMDAKVYDNFSLQKPGRAFYVKLRYFISKK